MIVVSNTSPIVNLAVVGGLHILRDLFHEILVPSAVQEEISAGVAALPALAVTQQQDWIKGRPVADWPLREVLSQNLDAGEAEAIALAVEAKADYLLVDERRARKIAQRLGIPVMGVLGCLVEAKRRGHIPVVKPWIESLRQVAGFRVSDDLVATVLRKAGE